MTANAPIRYCTGAPGSGKSSLVEPLTRRLPTFVVLDMDMLLDPAGQLAGVDLRSAGGAAHWPAYNELWFRVIRTISDVHPVLVLGPLTPSETASLPPIAWAALDCSDGTRRARLQARDYDEPAIANALADAAAIRARRLPTFSTERATTGDTAELVARWAEGR